MKLQDEFKSIIEKNLPAQVGDVLRERLAQAEKDAEAVIQYQKMLGDREKKINEMTDRLNEYQKLDIRNAGLDAREISIKEKERNIEIEKLTYQLKSEAEKTQFVRDVTMGLVRNTEYKRTFFDSISGPQQKDQFGNTIYPNTTQHTDETKHAE